MNNLLCMYVFHGFTQDSTDICINGVILHNDYCAILFQILNTWSLQLGDEDEVPEALESIRVSFSKTSPMTKACDLVSQFTTNTLNY